MYDFDELHDEDEKPILIPVDLEVYLRHREEPLRRRVVFPMVRDDFEMLDDDADLDRFVDIVLHSALAVLDIKGENRFVFTDERMSKFIIMVDEVQSISILAPEASTIQALLFVSE